MNFVLIVKYSSLIPFFNYALTCSDIWKCEKFKGLFISVQVPDKAEIFCNISTISVEKMMDNGNEKPNWDRSEDRKGQFLLKMPGNYFRCCFMFLDYN